MSRRFEADSQFVSDNGETPVEGPERRFLCELAGGKQLDVPVAEPSSHDAATLNESQSFSVSRFGGPAQAAKELEERPAIRNLAAGKFSDDEGMRADLVRIE